MDNQLFYTTLLILLIIWSLAWKGIALWHAARNGQLVWFIAMTLINLVGLLEITYILFFQRKTENSKV